MIRVPRDFVPEVLFRTKAMIALCHPRTPGSPGCLRAARQIRDELAKSCGRADLEEFVQHPASFFQMNRVLASIYLLAGTLFFIGGAAMAAAAALFSLGTFYLINNFIFLGRFFDPLFPKKTGTNAVGIMEPALEVRRQVILTAHHDSSPACSFLEKRQELYAFRILIPIAFYLVANIGALILAAGILPETAGAGIRAVLKISIPAGSLFIIPLFWYFGRTVSPGASDNLASSLALLKMAELFRDGQAGPLQHTRLVFLSLDGEENGQRGSYDYAHRHRAEMLGLPTLVFNMDTLARMKDLALLETDTNGLRRLSPRLTEKALRFAVALGYPIRAIRFPMGGGGTDAGQFARVGIEAASLIGISTRLIRKDIDYHTSRDTVEAMEPAALEAGVNIALQFVLDTDGEAARPG